MWLLDGNFTKEMIVMCKRSQRRNDEISFAGSTSTKYSDQSPNSGELWTSEPTSYSIIVYSIAIPVISALGIIGNALILAVLRRRNLKASTFTYLSVLAAADMVTCCLLLFSGLARGIFRCKRGWMEFDVFVHLPVGSVSSNITVSAAVCLALDRLLIVCRMPRCKPKFCDRKIARRLMIFFGFFITLINVPYCFIFTHNDRGEIITTKFFHSRLYHIQNWLQLVIFGLIPAVFLLVVNTILCQSVKKVLKRRELLRRCKSVQEKNRLKDQARLTAMLVGIVFVFLGGELPTHFASRRGAISLLYGGDPAKVQESLMERFRMYATLLNAIATSANFVLYCLLCQHFLTHLKHLFTRKSSVKKDQIDGRVSCADRQIEDNDVIDFRID